MSKPHRVRNLSQLGPRRFCPLCREQRSTTRGRFDKHWSHGVLCLHSGKRAAAVGVGSVRNEQ